MENEAVNELIETLSATDVESVSGGTHEFEPCDVIIDCLILPEKQH